MNPSRHGEVAVADVHRIVARDHHRIAIPVQRHCLAKRRIDKPRISLQIPAGAASGAGCIAIQRPGSGQALAEPRRVRGDGRIASSRGVDVNLVDAGLRDRHGLWQFSDRGK